MSRNPSIKDVPKSEWEIVYESDLVVVSNAVLPIAQIAGTSKYEIVPRGTYGSFDGDFWLVKNLKDNKQKLFFGETAWMSARSFAADLDFGAWSI